MKIVYATYIDNQPQLNYPIKHIVRHVSAIGGWAVYASDAENEKYLAEHDGIFAMVIDHKIKEPGDIAIAQNKCIDHIFEKANPDFVVWNQADIFIMPKGQNYINEFCVPKNLAYTAALGLVHLKCFHHCGFTYYGTNIIGRDAWPRIKFTGDGAYLGSGAADYCAKDDHTVDIGYLTIDQCRAHLLQHKKTWNSDDTITELDDAGFLKAIIQRHNHAGLIDEHCSPYFKIVKDMGLEAEYEKVKSMCSI